MMYKERKAEKERKRLEAEAAKKNKGRKGMPPARAPSVVSPSGSKPNA